MAVEGKNGGKKRSPYHAMGAIGRTSRTLRFIMQIIAIGFLAIFTSLCLFGYINQVQTGQSMVEWFLQLGGEVGDALTLVFTGNDGAPIDVTDQGVYIDGYAPDGADNIMDNGGGTGSSGSGDSAGK